MNDDAPTDLDVGEDRTYRMIFESVTCDQCNVTVPAARSCDCGDWQPRDDMYVSRRQGPAQSLVAALDQPITPSDAIEFTDAIAILSPWIADHFAALDALGAERGDPAPVQRSVGVLQELRRAVAAVPRRRPDLALWNPLDNALAALAEMASVQLKAMEAPSPEEAQAAEAIAQEHLDRAASATRTLNDRVERWSAQNTIKLPAFMQQASRHAYQTTQAEGFAELDMRGRELFERITGRTTAPVGLGVGLLLDLGRADQAFDEERLFRVASIAYGRYGSWPDKLVSVLNDPQWRQDLLNARRRFYEAQLTAETIMRELGGDRRLEAESVLRLGARIAESVSRTLLALMLSLTRREDRVRLMDYTAIHQAIRQAGLTEVLLGLDDAIRNASAHDDYEVEPRAVVLSPRRGPAQRVSDEDLVDTVLAGLETVAALFAGLDCVLVELGHPSAADRLDDFGTEDRVSMLVAAFGMDARSVRVHGNRLDIRGTTVGSVVVRPLTLIAAIAPYLPQDITQVGMELTRPDATLRVRAALAPLRRWVAAEGVAQDAAFIEFIARATINGRAVFPTRHVRFMSAKIAHGTIESPLAAVEGNLRELIRTALRLKDRELADALESFIAIKRANEGGPSAPAAAVVLLTRLAEFVGTPPGPWDDGSPRPPLPPSDAVAA